MGCLTAPSHRSVRMKFVVILSFLLLGVVLGDPRYRYGGYRGGYRSYGGHYSGYGGYRGYGGYYGYSYGKRDAEPDPRHRVRGYGYRGYGGRGGYGYRGYGYRG